MVLIRLWQPWIHHHENEKAWEAIEGLNKGDMAVVQDCTHHAGTVDCMSTLKPVALNPKKHLGVTMV
jgi:hypothetical protein